MPWTCATCDVELRDDQPICGGCGTQKTAWTLHVDQTRTLQISAQRVRLQALIGTSSAPLFDDDPGNRGYPVASTQVCPALPKATLLGLRAAGQLPAPAHRLLVRVHPRKLERVVTLTVEFSEEDEEDHTFSDGVDAELVQGSFDVQVVCVFGPEDVSQVSLPDWLHLVDVSEASEAGHAPSAEVGAVKRIEELTIEPVARRGVQVLEVEDICFATSREVLLPGGWSASDDLTGLTVCAGALEHARKHPELRLLVAGHADKRGSVQSNLVLSEDRARNVCLYLSGDKAGWAAHCEQHAEAQDTQSVLAWIAWLHEWDCDPGKIDGKWGKGSQGALDRFRARYAEDHGGEQKEGKPATAADWAAFFDLYDLELANKLKTDVARLSGLREQLRFTEPAFVGCSEHWPTERPGAPDDDSADRRVDVIFLPAGEVPALPGEPPGAAIYGEGGLEREYLTVDEAFAEPEPPYGNAPFEDPDCDYRPTHHDENPDWTGDQAELETYLNRSVAHEVALIGQPEETTCWATCAAMVRAWRDELEVDPAELSDKSGPWADYEPGLTAEQVALQHWKLKERAGVAHTAEELADLLEAHGPLWIASKPNGSPHARVVTGISGDGSGDATVVYVNDPWPAGGGAKQEHPFKTFAAHFGGLADGRKEALKEPVFLAHA